MQTLAPQIRDAVDTMETERCLPPSLVPAMKKTGVFRISWPRIYGGLELDPLSQVRIIEALSRLDGSVGWCGMIGAASGSVEKITMASSRVCSMILRASPSPATTRVRCPSSASSNCGYNFEGKGFLIMHHKEQTKRIS